MSTIAIIVTHNRLDCLKNCLSHLNNLSSMPDKILVIDNNSSDGTHEYLSSNQIDFIHSEVNTGSAGGWNLGINYALNNSYEFMLACVQTQELFLIGFPLKRFCWETPIGFGIFKLYLVEIFWIYP